MKTQPLVVITTELPPAICGIGTYTWLLRKHWPNERVHFLVVNATAQNSTTELHDPVTRFGRDPGELAGALERIGPATVLLQYAGRAYHRFGFPFWLPRVLARWKQRVAGARVAVFVHEVPAPLPLTSRHFLLNHLSKRVLRRLAGFADVLLTNTTHHAEALRALSGREDVVLVPIGSNIEVAKNGAAGRAADEFVLFGLPFGRLQTLQLFDAHIRQWLAAGLLRRLHLIGPADDPFTREADRIVAGWGRTDVVVRHGALPSEQVAHLLRTSGFGLTNATPETWSKSTTFMACAANACPIVIAAPARDVPLRYTMSADEVSTIARAEAETRAAKLKEWYDANADWPVTAGQIAALLRDRSGAV